MAVFIVAALVVLPGSATLVGQDDRSGENNIDTKPTRATVQVESNLNADEPNPIDSNKNDWKLCQANRR